MIVEYPIFPPKAGYVEDIDENGMHYMRKVSDSSSGGSESDPEVEARVTDLENVVDTLMEGLV